MEGKDEKVENNKKIKKEQNSKIDKKEEKNIKQKLKYKLKRNIFILILIFISIFVVIIMNEKNKARLTINAESTLEKIRDISDLSTIEYNYNAIVTKYKNDEVKDENIEYYVAYEGKVKAGIDFNEITVENIDYKAKKIFLKLPEVEIQETNVDMGTLDYLQKKSISEKQSISQEAYKLCKNDLKERAKKEENLIESAKENAKSTIEALTKPWLESVDKEFKIEFN